MPIQNYLSFRRMTNLCGTHIPPDIAADLERIQVRSSPPSLRISSTHLPLPQQHDDAAVKDYGINFAVKMMRALFENGVRGFHLCTLNLEKSVTKVLEALEWVEPGATRTKPTQRKVRSSSLYL
jgi:methylenetetrahydrofolate reductase (NADPH)